VPDAICLPIQTIRAAQIIRIALSVPRKLCVIRYEQRHSENQDGEHERSDEPDRNNVFIKRHDKPEQADHEDNLDRFGLDRRNQYAASGGTAITGNDRRKSRRGNNIDKSPKQCRGGAVKPPNQAKDQDHRKGGDQLPTHDNAHRPVSYPRHILASIRSKRLSATQPTAAPVWILFLEDLIVLEKPDVYSLAAACRYFFRAIRKGENPR
jgi:hypothetical protein